MTASQARAALLSGIANASDGNVHIDGIYSGGELTGYKVVRLVRENYGAQREEILFQSRCADTETLARVGLAQDANSRTDAYGYRVPLEYLRWC